MVPLPDLHFDLDQTLTMLLYRLIELFPHLVPLLHQDQSKPRVHPYPEHLFLPPSQALLLLQMQNKITKLFLFFYLPQTLLIDLLTTVPDAQEPTRHSCFNLV